MEPRIHYAKTSDGVNIAYCTMGDGPPFLWMPPSGMPLSHLQAEWQHSYLRAGNERVARHWTLIRYDPRGSGLSDREISDTSLDAYVSDVEAVADKLGLDKFRLWATGTNAPIALTYAHRHPERLAQLIMWHGAFRRGPPNTAGPIRRLGELAEIDWKLATESFALAFQGIAQAEVARQHAEYIRAAVTPEQFLALQGFVWTWDVTGILPSITVPTLIIQYSNHPYLPVDAGRALAAAMPNARLSLHDEQSAGLVSAGASDVIRAFLHEGEEQPSASSALPSGMTAILFADIVDSTALTERLGDGALAVFTSARQAIEAALACREAGDDAGLPLHLGLHAGDVIREDNNVYGGAVNVASRISGLSAAGEVLVSDTVRSLARTSAGVRFEDRGEQSLKGVGEAVRVWAVVEGE